MREPSKFSVLGHVQRATGDYSSLLVVTQPHCSGECPTARLWIETRQNQRIYEVTCFNGALPVCASRTVFTFTTTLHLTLPSAARLAGPRKDLQRVWETAGHRHKVPALSVWGAGWSRTTRLNRGTPALHEACCNHPHASRGLGQGFDESNSPVPSPTPSSGSPNPQLPQAAHRAEAAASPPPAGAGPALEVTRGGRSCLALMAEAPC